MYKYNYKNRYCFCIILLATMIISSIFSVLSVQAATTGDVVLYLNTTAANAVSGCPSTSRILGTTAPASATDTWPGEFDSTLPGNADAGQFLPANASLGNTTAAIEIMSAAQTSRNSASFGQGWMHVENLTGYNLSQGNFRLNLTLRGGQGVNTLTERIMARISIVNCSGGAFTLVQDLVTTNITGEGSHTNGQIGWGVNIGARFNHIAAGSQGSVNVQIPLNNSHLFQAGEYLLVEIGFGDADGTTDRTLGLRYNIAGTNLTTSTINLFSPQWSNNQTDSTTAGATINHSIMWTDDFNLKGYIFSFDNGTGTFVNDSFVTFSGTENFSNVLKDVNTTVGSTIRWRVYANDTQNALNVTTIFTYTTTNADTCTYPGSGNWNVNCADNCIVSGDVNLGGNNLSITGTGTFKLQAKIRNFIKLFIQGTDANNICSVRIDSSGGFLK